eukprot:1849166-Rhodomonas_salina.5
MRPQIRAVDPDGHVTTIAGPASSVRIFEGFGLGGCSPAQAATPPLVHVLSPQSESVPVWSTRQALSQRSCFSRSSQHQRTQSSRELRLEHRG